MASFGTVECEALTTALSGIGVDEKSIISESAKWNPEQTKSFRKTKSQFFREDDRFFERWDDHHLSILEIEFSRFKRAAVLWVMHPWERDARLAHEVILKGQPSNILIEIACSRSSEELLGARRAYHSLFYHSLEEDIAYHARGSNRSLLVALASSYRYEGTWVNQEIAKSEAKIFGKAIKHMSTKKPIENEEVIRILSTRSKLQLKDTFKHYKEMFGEAIGKDLDDDLSLQATVQCLTSPPSYYCKLLKEALDGANESAKEALTRVIISRADVDMKEIKEEYQTLYGVTLASKIEEATRGNYKEFLLALAGRIN